MNMTAEDFNRMFGISATIGNGDYTDQELRMWVVELLIENVGSVAIPDAAALVRYIKTGEG